MRQSLDSSCTIMADSAGSNRPRPTITMGRPKTRCDMQTGRWGIGRLNRPHSILTTRRYVRTLTRSQVVDESASHPGTQKWSLADRYTRQAPLTSLPQHRPVNIRHRYLRLLQWYYFDYHSFIAFYIYYISEWSSTPAHIGYFFITVPLRQY